MVCSLLGWMVMVANGAADFHQASVRANYRTLIEGFVALKPKKRTNKVSWIVMAGCAYIVCGLLGDASVREALFSPRGQARAPQYVATAPVVPARAPIQVRAQQPTYVQYAQPQAQPVVTFPAFAVPASAPPAIAPLSDPNLVVDAPLPHAKAHHTAPTKRAHSRATKRK